jgi:hypothetical protein
MSSPADKADNAYVCVVEIPKGNRNKYEFDPELGRIKFDRLLMSAATYPTDYEYLRDTLPRMATRSTRWSVSPSRRSPGASFRSSRSACSR